MGASAIPCLLNIFYNNDKIYSIVQEKMNSEKCGMDFQASQKTTIYVVTVRKMYCFI